MLNAAKRSVHYGKSGYISELPCLAPIDTDIRVLNMDCLEAAKRLIDLDGSAALLNMASATNPGGGWLGGAGAQEENLHRRSNLSDFLSNHRRAVSGHNVRYPLGEFGCIFSPDVCVFRGAEADGYPFLPHPFFVSVLSVAAYCRPKCRGGRLTEKFARGTQQKILILLRVAKRHNVKCLVLSALGCGAFANPPCHIAEIFREVLSAHEFAGQFQRVWFAIIEDHNSPGGGNVAPFRNVFGDGVPESTVLSAV